MLALILSRHDWREYDQRIVCYTLEYGKKEFIARGVKKIISKLSSSLEPGTTLMLETVAGAELGYIISVEPISLRKEIRSNFKKMVLMRHGLALLESAISNPESDPALFALVIEWLDLLDEAGMVPGNENLLVGFIWRLAGALGFRPRLDSCVHCGEALSSGYFSVASGGVLHEACSPVGAVEHDRFFAIRQEELGVLKKIQEAEWIEVNNLAISSKLEHIIRDFWRYHNEKITHKNK